MQDTLISFVFDQKPIRGKIVSINSSWKDIVSEKSYDEQTQLLLGNVTTANILLASTLKFEGSMQVRLESDESLQMIISECRHDLSMRAMAKRRSDDPLPSLSDCRLAINLELQGNQQRYQSIVPTTAGSLNRIFESYLIHSEQIPSLIRLDKLPHGYFGILIQRMPDSVDSEEDEIQEIWNKISHSIVECDSKLLESPDPEPILRFLFPEDDIKVLPSRSISMRCNCSRERIGSLITSLGQDEANQILEDEGHIMVHCEFCGKSQKFDSIDTAQLFSKQ